MTIRAKFRCLSITTKYDGLIIAALAPVKRDGNRDPENAEFWKYSPNGECELTYARECPLSVGAYYYLDWEKKVESCADTEHGELWRLSRREEWDRQLNVELFCSLPRADYRLPPPPGFVGGRFKIGMTEEASGARAGFQPVRSRWTLTLTFAEDSDS